MVRHGCFIMPQTFRAAPARLVHPRAIALVVALTFGSPLTACDDGLSPEDFAGEYVLVTVGGTQLPLRIVTARDTHYVWSERLFVEGSAGARTETQAETRRDNGSKTTYTIVSDYGTAMEGDRLVLMFICPINALCTQPTPLFLYRERDGGVRLENRGSTGPYKYVRSVFSMILTR